jgi:C-terminal processing protease CtpA/Prc
LFISIFFIACGGGGGSGSNPSKVTTITGTFVDSPVEGLRYVCSSGSQGTTNSNGQYICNDGDRVKFYIGDVYLGDVKAQKEFITPYTVFPDDNDAAINLARLLQTLDEDGNPDNDITLDMNQVKKLPKTLNFKANNFETQAQNSLGKALRNRDDSIKHLQASIANSSGSSTTFDASQKHFLFNLFNTEYLWVDNVSSAHDYSSYKTYKEMINAIKYTTYDKWSYAQTLKEYNNKSKQATTGFGIFTNSSNIVTRTRIDSPADKVGIRRGDKILYYSEKSKRLVVSRNNTTLYFNIVRQAYNYKVSKSQIIERGNKKIGHIIYNSFTSSSVAELDTIFDNFKAHNITELIVDLRYNGGGSLAVASIFLDKIAGYGREGSLQAKLNWNTNYQTNNYSYTFEQDNNSIQNITRVFFLTTTSTASASEMMINSLKPYVDVITIGSTTRGKPVGMRGRKNKGLIYWLINFEMLNADNEGSYYSGIAPTCTASDNLNFQRNDTSGDMLSKALYYIDNGSCE